MTDVADFLTTEPSDMVMTLYLRTIHPEFFRIFNRRQYQAPGCEAELWITGLSHVFTVRRRPNGRTPQRCVTEIIAPQNTSLPDRGKVEELKLTGNMETHVTLRNGFAYQLNTQCETIADDDVFAAIYEDLRNQGHREGLSCEYRINSLDRTLWPLAMAVPQSTRDGFLLHSFHIFPDFKAILKTQTLIEVPQRDA